MPRLKHYAVCYEHIKNHKPSRYGIVVTVTADADVRDAFPTDKRRVGYAPCKTLKDAVKRSQDMANDAPGAWGHGSFSAGRCEYTP